MIRSFILLASALFYATLIAQDPSNEAFLDFVSHMETLRDSAHTLRDESDYVLVWKEVAHGAADMLFQGDGSALSDLLQVKSPAADGMRFLPPYFHGVTYFGDRFAMALEDEPTSLPRFTRWYFERKTE